MKAADPGNLETNLYQNMPKWQLFLVKRFALKPPIFGAYTELFAGLSKDITMTENGAWIIPWGKVSTPREDIAQSCRPVAQGGSGVLTKFWDWCEHEVASYT